MGHSQEGLARTGRTEPKDQLAATHGLQITCLGGGLGGNLSPSPGGQGTGGRAAPHPHLPDRNAHIGFGDLMTLVGTIGQGLHHTLGRRPALGVAVEGNAAPGCLD